MLIISHSQILEHKLIYTPIEFSQFLTEIVFTWGNFESIYVFAFTIRKKEGKEGRERGRVKLQKIWMLYNKAIVYAIIPF